MNDLNLNKVFLSEHLAAFLLNDLQKIRPFRSFEDFKSSEKPTLQLMSLSGWGYENFTFNFLNHIFDTFGIFEKFEKFNFKYKPLIYKENHIFSLQNHQPCVIFTHSYGLYKILDFLLNLKKLDADIFSHKKTSIYKNFVQNIQKIYILNGFLNLTPHQQAIEGMLKNLAKNRVLATLKNFYQLCEAKLDTALDMGLDMSLDIELADKYSTQNNCQNYQNYKDDQISHLYSKLDSKLDSALDLKSQTAITQKLIQELQNMHDLPMKKDIYLPLLNELAPISCYIHGEYDAIVGAQITAYGDLLQISAQHIILQVNHLLTCP